MPEQNKYLAIFFCRRESPMCNKVVESLMSMDVEFKILEMPLSVIFLLKTDLAIDTILPMLSSHGVKTMSLIYDVSEAQNFCLSYQLPKEHDRVLTDFVNSGRLIEEELYATDAMRDVSSKARKKESVSCDMTLDELLDLANELGGVDKLNAAQRQRLHELSK